MLTFRDMEPLTPEEQKLVEDNIGLAKSYAHRWNAIGANYDNEDDIYQCAMIGLMRSVKTWDPSMASLATYSYHTIKRVIQSYLIGDCTIRPPENKVLISNRIKKKMAEDPDLTYESCEIRRMYNNYSADAIRKIVESELYVPVLSLDSNKRSGTMSLSNESNPKLNYHNIVPSEDTPQDEKLSKKQEVRELLESIDKLPLTKPSKRSTLPRDIKRIVIREHCLAGRTLDSVGKEYGVSREWVRKIRDESIADLRRLMK